jgi:tRNA-splicing ligase RtcB
LAASERKPAALREDPVPYTICGEDLIEPGARAQMLAACRLPVSVRGFLAPDAHAGYGLPVGGVLATENAVIPYAVGVDIACRMKLSIMDVPANRLKGTRDKLKKALVEETAFGLGCDFARTGRREHDVMDDPAWGELEPQLRQLHHRAWDQLGSSGGGNHFVEWGEVELKDDSLGMPAGTYIALLSHSGSRGFGGRVADHYTKRAMALCSELPREFIRLAWLGLDTADGQAYWHAMTLAGKYAAANHDCIHRHVLKAAGLKPALQVENHHNFAWMEEHDGRTVVVHRKGATPAGAGVLGIIPGSMGDPGFLVRGRGDKASLESASHGAGRRMSRTAAKQSITRSALKKYLAQNGVELLAAGIDEAPMAYKDIREVMARQEHLVETLGVFHPRLVMMAADGEGED